jgi:ABC-type microcin C transport system duplicated ATPase subunit YejF
MSSNNTLLEVKNLEVKFSTFGGTVEAVRQISFSVGHGETLAIVGESGCGKSVTVQSIMGLLASPPARINADRVHLFEKDILHQKTINGKEIRGNEVGMIFQDPMSSLNPTMKIGNQVAETLIVHRGYKKSLAQARATELLDMVKIPEPKKRTNHSPRCNNPIRDS